MQKRNFVSVTVGVLVLLGVFIGNIFSCTFGFLWDKLVLNPIWKKTHPDEKD